jgi:hypothetical protein
MAGVRPIVFVLTDSSGSQGNQGSLPDKVLTRLARDSAFIWTLWCAAYTAILNHDFDLS